MKKVILIYPKFGLFFTGRPPLPVLCLAAYLERAGMLVSIFDINHESDWRKKVLKEAEKALCVGISAMTGNQIRNGLEITDIIKEKFPHLPIIWGGSHHSLLPEQALQEKNIDIVVRGEGEETLLELVRSFEKGKDIDSILGISFKKNGKIVHNPDRPFLNMDDLPDPAWRFVDIDNYYFSNLSSRNVVLETSRGCPHRCEFCVDPKLNKRNWRCMSAKRIVETITFLKEKYRIDGIVFWDDNFFVDSGRVEEFCKLSIKHNLNIKWEADCRADYLCRMDDDFLKLLKSAGLDAFFIGAESGSQKVLDTIKKDITVEQIIKSAEITAKYGFKAWYAFVIGFPGETKKDVLTTIEMMKKVREINPLANVAIKVFFLVPGSSLYERARKEGFVLPNNLLAWADYRSEDIKNPWLKHGFSLYFPICARFAVDYSRFSGLTKNPIIRFFVNIIHYLEKFRWNHNFYHFPIELIFIKKITKKLGLY